MRSVPPLGGTTGDPFVDANPGAGTPGSVVPAEAFNALTGEILAVINDAGLTPNQGDLTQLRQAIDQKISAALIGIGGDVTSVNGQVGAVTLDAADVGGVPTSRTLTAGTGLSGGGALSANRSFDVDFASAADIRDGGVTSVAIAPNTATVASTPVSLTFGSTVNWAITSGINFAIQNVTSNFTIANPSSQVAGQSGTLRLYSVALRTISWGSHFRSARDSLPDSIQGEMLLGWMNTYNGRIYIS